MMNRERYRFGTFVLDASERQLANQNESLPLPPKAFDLLLGLVRHAGHLVTKRELLQAIWPDTLVEEGILAVHVSTLRKTLDAESGVESWIETVARSGYRFRSNVTRLPDSYLGPEVREQDAAPRASEPDIAVLPFVNLSADPDNEYFSDGLTEEIISTLGRIPGLRVIARTSVFAFKNKPQDIRRIARALGVAHVLEGSVRKSGDRLRIAVQLIAAADGRHLWCGSYERETSDVFAVQDEIAQAAAAALQVKLATETTLRRYVPKAPAYEAFLRGLHHLNKMTPESMLRAREHLERAISHDSGFADAYSQLAVYFITLAANSHRPAREVMPLARDAAQRALEIDPSLAEANSVLGTVAALFDFDWGEAERWHGSAMVRLPVSPRVRIGYSRHLLLTGRPADGAEEASRALKEDPLDRLGRLFLAHCLQAAGNTAGAAEQIRQVLELDENFWLALLLQGLNWLAEGRYADALVPAKKAYSLAPWNSRVVGLFAGILKRMGDASGAEAVLQRLGTQDMYGAPNGLMLFHLACSEIEKGAEWAEDAIEQRDPVAIIHLLGPDRYAWSSSSRWGALAKKMNLAL